MKIIPKTWITKYWLLIFFVILFLFMPFFRISFKDIWKTVSVLKLWQITLLIMVYFFISFFHIIVRKYLLHSLNTPCGLKNLTLIHFSSMAAHYSTPAKIGFPLTVYLLKKFENVPYACGTAMILIELTVSTGICGIIAFIGGLLYFGSYLHIFIQSFFIFFFSVILIFFGIKIFFKNQGSDTRIKKIIINIDNAFSHIALYNLIVYIIIMVIIQIFSSINLVLLSLFFSADLLIWEAVTASCTAFFMGAVSMIPMGLGVREVSMLFYLKQFGIDSGTGITIVTIQRLLSTGLSFVLGAIFGTVIGIKNISKQAPEV